MKWRSISRLVVALILLFKVSPVSTCGEAASSQTPLKLLVLPVAFSAESRANYGEWIEKLTADGFGNAIWQEIEDLFYEESWFDLVTAPDESDDFQKILQAVLADREQETGTRPLYERPDLFVQINSNFFVRETERLRGTRVERHEEFHVTIYLRMFDLRRLPLNRPIIGRATSVQKDPMSGGREAAKAATEALLRRVRNDLKFLENPSASTSRESPGDTLSVPH